MMSTMRRLSVLVLALAPLAAASALPAQVAPLGRGGRVRIWAEGAAIVGRVTSLTDSSITLVRDGSHETVEMPTRLIAALEVSAGRRVRVWPMIGGILAGSVIGGLFDGSTAIAGDTAKDPGLPSVIGMAAGALVASRFKADKWVAVTLPAQRPLASAGAVQQAAVTDDAPAAWAEPARAASGPPTAAPWNPIAAPGTPGAIQAAVAPGEFGPGARIRYTVARAPAVERVGRLLRMDGDTMVVAPEAAVGTMRVPMTSVATLAVSEGRHRQTVRGVLIGAIVGSVLYSATLLGYVHDSNDAAGLIMLGIYIGAPIGAGMGAAAGALVRTEHWRAIDHPAPIPAAVRVTRDGRVQVSMRVGI